MTDPTPQQILDLPLGDNDANAPTVRAYLVALLAALWQKAECFSPKRPLGNSDWQDPIYHALVKAKLVTGYFDYAGDLEDADVPAADELILSAIQALGEDGAR